MGEFANFGKADLYHGEKRKTKMKIYIMEIFFQPIPSQPSHILHIIHNIPPHTTALLCYNLTIKRKGAEI
jgi:hypothetical protein